MGFTILTRCLFLTFGMTSFTCLMTSGVYFEDGYDHHYTYSSESDVLGMHNVTTVIKFRIRSVNATSEGGVLHQLIIDSFVQHSEHGYVADNPLKWDLNNRFYFTISPEGLVHFVHFHPEEIHELITLKKVLVSTLATRVQIEDGQIWMYDSMEEDHTGHLGHTYEASRTSEGMRLLRSHRSLTDVHRMHYKTTHLDDRLTPQLVEAIDNITLQHSPNTINSHTVEGAAVIEEEHSGEFPKVSSISRSKLKLMLKSKHSDPARDHALHEMHRDSISVKPKPLKKVPLVQVEEDIRKYIACVHSYTNKYERNRTECVHQLRELITSLERKDFLTLGEEALTRTCDVNDSVCVDERNLFIDLIAREGSAEAQLLVLEHVMSQPNVTEEDLRRCLFHAIALQSPVTELVSLVETLCFEDGHESGETPALTKTRKRACLSLGAMAKSLHDLNTTVSDRIVERIENWLDHHNETRSSDIIKPRRRRSIIQHDTLARKHIETKMVILQSLGNAGKQRSLRHIMSYMAPNVGVTAWRRAAINGLRHFSCKKSADALLTSIIHDHDEVVRKTAHTVFKKHPKADDRNFTIEHETEVISKHYTYPIVSRVRRSLLQALEEGIRVTIQPPGIDWQKTIGTENIGASFGLIIRNILDLKLALLSGHFMVDVYDGAYAEAHVGMIGLKIDIVKAYVCFKGHIEYDLNVLKDFGINSLSDLVTIFDKIMDKIVNPIINAIKAFKQILTMFKGGKTLTKVVNEIVDIVKNLPTRLGEVANRMRDCVKELFSISANTVIEEIKSIAKEVSDFIDGIKNDALKFYNDVVDVVTMALPYTAKKIMDAFNSIVEAVGKLFQNPMQAMTSMSRAIKDIKVAVTMAIDVKNKVVEACLFIKGRVVEWINAAKKIPAILGRIKDVFKKLTDSIKDGVQAIKNEAKSAISDGISAVKDTMHDVVNNLKCKWDHVFEPLQTLIKFVTLFVDIFKSIMDGIQGVKWGYQELKKVIETSKSLVQKVFGPKFDRNFPTKRRDAFEECPSGVWPSTANGAYGTTGVDIILGEGQTVHMPVNGILKSYRDEKKVVVKPSDPEFYPFEIVVENIDANQSLHEKTVKAGEKIGKATTARVCKERKLSIDVKEAGGNPQDPNTDKPLEIIIGEAKKNERNEWMSTVASRGKNSIHVSVRKAQKDELPDSDYDYTDPSPFLDRVVPTPKWIQDCNDHEFRYIGQTFESGESDEDEDPDKKEAPVKRRKPDAENIDGMLGDEDTKYRPNDPSLYDPRSFGDSLKESLKQQAKQFAEMFKQALFGSNPKIPNILEIVDVNSKTVGWIREKLNATSEIGMKFIDILRKLACTMKAEPSESSATLTPNLAIHFLKLYNFKFNFGGFDFNGGLNFGGSGDDDNSGGFKFGTLKFGDAGQLFLSMAELPGKLCPMFKDAIAKGFGHICYVHEDCLGLSCNIPVPLGPNSTMLNASIALVPSELKIEISVLGRNYTIKPNGEDQHIEVANFLHFKVLFIVNAKIEGTSVTLTAEIQLCNDLFMTCMPPIELFHNLKLIPNAVRHKRATGSCTDDSIRQTLITTFMMQLSEFYLLNKDVTATLENVRHQVVDQLLKDTADKFMTALTEFPNKVDFCVSANIPVPQFDITFFNIRQLFMVGPVPLSLGFGAGGSVGLGVKVGLCVVSMTTELTLTPWVGGKVWGDAAIDIGFARGGIRLIGYLLETKFPMTTELVFSKYPIDVGAKMDLVLTPLRLELKAFAELYLLFTTVTIFEGTIWKYQVPTIRQNIFTKKKRDDDPSPPDVLPTTINERRRRAGPEGCIVYQVYNRAYYDTAFTLEMFAQDEVSEVKLTYAIGTHKGGTNVQAWTEMGGNTLLVPAKLPGGIPLHWTVSATNTQGLSSTVQCSLNTYDSTLPDGRVEHPYKYSSHPSKLVAIIIVAEDSPLKEMHYKAVGYSPGQYGNQFVGWEETRLDHSPLRQGVTGALQHFTTPMDGKLIANVLKTAKPLRSPDLCAEECMNHGSNCVSFSYEYHSETCDLHDQVAGANAYLRISGTYKNYERLGIGYHTSVEYDNLPLTQGTQYFVNAKVTNVLGYVNHLIGEGTMVDFTPPEPGLILNNQSDFLRADQCNASVSQRCLEVTRQENHRIIIDGPGSETVFNGPQPVQDELYTLTNHYVAANWKGFHDDESGIYAYTWAVGKSVCSSDVVPFTNPYAHLTNPKFWTDSAFQKGIHLPDGPYFVTVQALNRAELGGSLVTTVCHSTPFIVDTSPPVFHKVTDIIYDEDFDLIAIYYNATDDLSKIVHVEFGLGKTKYDVQLKAYGLHAPIEREDPFVAVKDLGLQEGIPAWIRIRVTNNVDLFIAGHGDEPILIDRSPPIPGVVMDGNRLRRDRQFQADDHNMCAQWIDFFDPESGIDRFLWGVGTAPQLDDIVQFHNLTRYEKSSCVPETLKHNSTYFSTVLAFNSALNSKPCNSSSDGVLVDTTPPIVGIVLDGIRNATELKYTSETVSKHANWRDYYDPESGIANYKVDVYINNEKKKTFETGTLSEFEDHTISMEHKDEVYFEVHGVNGAELEAVARSDSFIVDHTPPIMTEISDNKDGNRYQADKSNLCLKWDFFDSESGIEKYRTVIYESRHGIKQKHWPASERYNETKPMNSFNGKMDSTLGNLNMEDGVTYSLHVTAFDGALLATAHESTGVMIDTTPPSTPKVKVGLPTEDEEVDQGKVLHNDQYGIRLSWSSMDSESGISKYEVAVGTNYSIEKILPFTDYGTDTTAYISNIFLEPFTTAGTLYVVTVKASNGAELVSDMGVSKEIKVQKANIRGVVFDGRSLFEDESFTTDHTSIASSFYGFESESCDIIHYDWAIGRTEFGTDILTYTNYGLVMLNDTHGQCQIHIELFEDVTYYITVRAVTGCPNKKEKYIVSSSDGITLDRVAPKAIFRVEASNDTIVYIQDNVIYQSVTDSIAIVGNISDNHEIQSLEWSLGSLPSLADIKQFTHDLTSLTSVASLVPGEAVFVTLNAVDKAGNHELESSFAVIADTTAPEMIDLECTQFISVRKSIVTCSWSTIVENESILKATTISMGTTQTDFDILDSFVVYKDTYSFTRDFYNHISQIRNTTVMFITVTVWNVVGHKTVYGREVIVDRTAPLADRLDVLTSTLQGTPVERHQKCQLPRGYVEVKLINVVDKEAPIDVNRYEIALGSKPLGTDYLEYHPVIAKSDGIFFVNGFRLNQGELFYVTMRIYNEAGLSSEFSSDSVVVSQTPFLEVKDGTGEQDIDFQSTTNLIQGSWKYSDACPIGEAKWKIESLAGNILFDFQPIPNAGQMFYNDEVQLENGMKYIVTVQTIDFLGRVKTARSDGVTVRIQPPFPGLVRDGIDKDLTYQFSTTELSTNWDNFGDKSSDPTQSIHHYEVAIGNDRRYEKTRSNVHFFVDVGLNTSYTFSHLNLTSKLVRYYVTVRAYSMAGGFTEGYSNGIRVGYNDDIIPGSVSVNKYQFSVDSMAISWNGFQSDIDIIDYKVAISSHEDIITNDTVVCNIITANKTMYDISPLRSVGLDEYSKLLGLTLFHNSTYYVTVVAEDEAGMCTGITSDWVLVDTTSPEFGKLYINDIESSTIIYARKPSEMQIEWEMHDHESGINNVLVQLFECSSCMSKGVTSENCYLVDKNSVKNDTKTAFYELQMNPQKAYYVTVEVTNEANLVTRVQSLSILVDTTPPLIGELKITDDWHDVETFQHSTYRLSGMLPIALTATDYLCPSQILYFPVSSDIRMKQVMDKFDDEFLVVNNTGAYLGIGYNSDLTDITKSGVISESMNLQNGNYSFNVRVAKGYQTITTVAIVTDQMVIPFFIDNKPEEVEFDYSKFENVTGLEAGNSTQDDYTNITTTTAVPNVSSMPNNSTNGSISDLETEEYGIGIHLLGYKIGNNKYYHHVFWAKGKYTSSLRWFQTDKDLNSEQSFTLWVSKKSEYLDNTVDVTLIVGGEEVVSISGFKFTGAVKLAALTWNEENFKPPLEDIYTPFYSDAILSSIYVPDMHDKFCRHGRGFFDGESGIKELWIGASDNNVLPGNIRALELYKTFCFPCLKPCDTLCNETCTAEKLLDGFNMISIDLTNVHLESSENSTECANITSDKTCNITAYYLNAKLVNFAGDETIVFSNGIQIDLSPPYCEYVKCTSPEYSEDQPTNFTGSSSTIGAFWNCTEKTSQIVKFTVQIINKESGAVVMDNVDVGLKSKATFNLNNGTFQNEKHYDVRVYALNSAGLTSIASCSVQVILFPPDVSKVISGPLYTNQTNTADDQEPYWTESQSQIGIQWQGGTPDIGFYEWRVGTQSDGDDLFPPSKVGVNTTGSSAIVHGKVHYNDKYINRTVSEYRDILNMSTEERNKLTSASEAEKSFYQMEPGRCVHQSLYAIGLSHLKSNIKKETVCIKRAGDVNLKKKAGASTLRAVRPVGSVNWMETNDAVAADIVVESELTTGGITLGTLTKQDIQETYGSAATAEYRPFISNVETTQKKTSRLLRNRIHHLCDVNFFLSPAPRAEASRVTIHLTVGLGCEKDTVYQPALVFWDTEKEVWVHIDEGCNEILSANFSSGVYSSMICPDFNSAVRKKRDASIELESPLHYSLVKIEKTFINYPPKIVSKTLDITEDVIADLTIETEDPEDDTLIYNIVDEPENLQCNITSDGNLRCKAIEDDFYGEDDVTVEVTETDLPAFEQPMSHTKQLKLVIHGTPDKTERFFFDSNETFYAEKRPSFWHTILVNANRSSTHYAGRVVLADVDGGEIFFPIPRFSALGDAACSLKRLTNTSDIPLTNYTTRRYRSVEAYDIEFEYSPDLQGNMTLDFIARNADGIYTPGVTIYVYVLENPCIHGQCHHPILGYDACEDPARSRSFSGFECVCEPGYIGDWCQIEEDECQSSPCSSMYDCEDLVNCYQCNINIPKLLAVIVCLSIALIVLVYVLRVGLMENCGRQIGDNRPATSSGIHVDDKDDVSSEDDDVMIWQHNPIFFPAGKAQPPHHANVTTFKGVQEMELEQMELIQPRQREVPNRRFDVTMLAEYRRHGPQASPLLGRSLSRAHMYRPPSPGVQEMELEQMELIQPRQREVPNRRFDVTMLAEYRRHGPQASPLLGRSLSRAHMYRPPSPGVQEMELEQMELIQPRQREVPNRRFDVTMLAEYRRHGPQASPLLGRSLSRAHMYRPPSPGVQEMALEQMELIQPRQREVPNRRFDVTMLAEYRRHGPQASPLLGRSLSRAPK